MIELYLLIFCYLLVGTILLYTIVEDWGQNNLIDLCMAFGVWVFSPVTLPIILGVHLWRQNR